MSDCDSAARSDASGNERAESTRVSDWCLATKLGKYTLWLWPFVSVVLRLAVSENISTGRK
jgi:hypothetical protein